MPCRTRWWPLRLALLIGPAVRPFSRHQIAADATLAQEGLCCHRVRHCWLQFAVPSLPTFVALHLGVTLAQLLSAELYQGNSKGILAAPTQDLHKPDPPCLWAQMQ